MRFFRRQSVRDDLAVSMVGVKLGDRLLQMGAGDGKLFASLAAKVGLTGRACIVDESTDGVTRAQASAAAAGVLIEATRAPCDKLPFDPEAFDLVVMHDLLPHLTPERRTRCVREAYRVLRRGGRCLIVEPAPRGGLGGILQRSTRDPYYRPGETAEATLSAERFRAVRTLAAREGLAFIEGVKAAP